MTPGEALRILDVPKEDWPNAPPWEKLSEARQYDYACRAADVLDLADKIRALMNKE